MSTTILLLVLLSAIMHPVWNLLVKKNPDPELGFLMLTVVLTLCALIHGLWAGVDFAAAYLVIPLIGLSIVGQIFYGVSLTATLKRGDLSTYYPIIRASPVFIVIVSVLFLGKSYPFLILLGIAMVVAGAFLLLYRRGSNIFDDWRTLGLAVLALCGSGIYSLADSQSMNTIEPQVLVFFVEGVLILIYATRWLRGRSSDQISFALVKNFSPVYVLLPGVLAYASYYLILVAYQLGGEVAAVTSIRQASIPISVMLGGLFLREGAIIRRLFAASILALGIVVIALNG